MSRLSDILLFVNSHNAYYRSLAIKNALDINSYPVMTRRLLQEYRYSLFSDEYKNAYYMQKLIYQSSSGSTGRPVTVYWDKSDWYASNLPLWRYRKKWYGINSNDKRIIFCYNYLVNSDSVSKIRFKINSNVLTVDNSSLTSDQAFRELISEINAFKPIWLYIQPTVLIKLLDVIESTHNNLTTDITYIEAVGEWLTAAVRERASKILHASISNMYGSEEMNGIAFECPCHTMHVLEENVFVEIEKNGNFFGEGQGTSVITNLHNHAMPLIRYAQGDFITLENTNQCKCGIKGKIIKQISGRINDIFTCDGITIDSRILSEIMDNINERFEHAVSYYKFIYLADSKVLSCYLSFKNDYINWFHTISESFQKELSLFVGKKIPFQLLFNKVLPDKKSNGKQKILEINYGSRR